MEILQTIWNAVTTSNPGLTNIFLSVLVIIEMTVTMQLFITVLNIQSTRKQKVIFVIVLSIVSCISRALSNIPTMQFLHFILYFLFIMFCFKTTVLKTLLAETIPLLVISLLEPLFVVLFTSMFNIKLDDISSIPIYRVSFVLLIYSSIYILTFIIKRLKFSRSFIEHLDVKNRNILILNSIFGLIAIFSQIYLFRFYSENMPYLFTAISILGLVAYFFISIYSLTKTFQLQRTQQDLEESQLYNKSLKILHDNNRAFKHDFSNIVQAIGRIRSNS